MGKGRVLGPALCPHPLEGVTFFEQGAAYVSLALGHTAFVAGPDHKL